MAHQAHNIPWNVLAGNLKPVFPQVHDLRKDDASNFYFRLKPQQSKELKYFITAFAKNIEAHTRCERSKYPATYTPPSRSDILLSDGVVKRISSGVGWFLRRPKFDSEAGTRIPACRRITNLSRGSGRLCPHEDGSQGFECGCAIPFKERKADAFLREYIPNPCYEFFDINLHGFYNLEILKLLLQYGEMDPILRICAHPDVKILTWETKAPCYDLVCSNPYAHTNQHAPLLIGTDH